LLLPGGLITILTTIPNNRQRVTDQPFSDELNSTVVLVVMASGCRECACLRAITACVGSYDKQLCFTNVCRAMRNV
jgi:hypothetical protein